MKTKPTREAYGEALVELGKKNDKIVVLDADLSKSTKTVKFKNKFPDRFFNIGIAEGDLMGTAAGMATSGMIPFASTFAIFAAGRAYEQIRNTIAYPGLNVKICPTHSGISVGEDGGSHQAIEDISLMRSIPGMTVLSPADAVETKKMIHAVSKFEGPVYVRLGRLTTPILFDNKYEFEIGKAVTMKEGKDVTIFATGIMVYEAIEAAKILEEKDISVKVVNISTIKPIDKDGILKAVKNTKLVVTAEEHSIIGGLGSAVSDILISNNPMKVVKIGIYDRFGESGPGAELLEKFNLKAKDIVKKIIENIG